MRQFAALSLMAVSLALVMAPLDAQTSGAPGRPQTAIGSSIRPAQAQIRGVVVTPTGDPIANTLVQARNLLSGEIGGSTSTTGGGHFALSVNPGSYVLEIVDGGGQVVGTSSFISATAGSAITAATVTATAGVLTTVTTTTGLVATLGTTALRTVTSAAAAAGIAGIVAPPDVVTASPSR